MFDILPVVSPRSTDCGATCLKMLLAYYGQDVALETLISETNTRLIGCSAKDLVRVGSAHGLDMKAWQTPAADLYDDDRPSIVWWMYNHWCIYAGLDDDGRVVIVNPDKGQYRVSKGVFKSFYSGVQLTNGEPQEVTPNE